MKGLLLKDLYMLKAYCKSYILVVAVFLAASFFGGNMFFIYYPCLICGMIPVNLLAYDERSRFIRYSSSLPVSRAQTVSAKYLIGLFVQIAVLLISGITQGIRMSIDGSFAAREFAVILLTMLPVSMLASSIPLPFIFRSGVEKGRIAYSVMIAFVCAASGLFARLFKGSEPISLPPMIVFVLLALIGIGVYALSWYLSIVFYRKREL